MSLEETLDRIATAAERIAAYMNHKPADLPRDVVNEVHAETPAADPKKVIHLARSVATDPAVAAAHAKTAARIAAIEKEAIDAATAKAGKAAATNGHATNGAKVVSFDEMKNGLVGVKVKFGAEASRTVMGKVGATNVQEIKPADFGTVLTECARLMG
jgi:hypothetical protein